MTAKARSALQLSVLGSLLTAGLLAFFSLAYQTKAQADYAVERVNTHTRLLNWIGQALEEVAEQQGTRLPPRPIVPE